MLPENLPLCPFIFRPDFVHNNRNQYLYLLDKLSAYQEGDATLLDNSAVVWMN